MTKISHDLGPLLASLPKASPTPAREAITLRPCPTPCQSLALREVLSFPPAYLAQLPLATTLLLCLREGESELWLWVTSGRANHAALVADGQPVISARGLAHLAAAAESGRSSREALSGWLQMGGPVLGTPSVESVAYGGAYALETPNSHWSLGRVLDAWGLTLTALSVGDGSDCEVLV
jgi:hypothetical protein